MCAESNGFPLQLNFMNLACRIVWSVIATTTASINIHVSGAAHHRSMLGSCRTIHRPLTAERFLPLKDSSDDSTVDDEYIQRFGNVARLYPAYRRDSSESTAHRSTGEGRITLDRSDGSNDIMYRLLNTHVCVIGLGGVGSWVVEALARSGIGRMTLIDMDDICISNTNRQVMAQTSTVGKFKAEVLRDRVLDINPKASVHVDINFVRPDTADELLTHIESNRCSSSDGSQTVVTCYSPRFDFVVDATDSVSDKAAIIDACIKSGTPVVTSGGVGGLINPGLITVSDLAHVKGDNLLMRVRKKLRQQYGYPLSVGQRGGKKKVKRWGIQAVHTLPTGFSRSLTTASDTCSVSVSSSGSDDNDGDGDVSDAVDKTTDSSDAASQSFRKCDVSFGNACFATGAVGFMLASCVINAIGLNSDTIPKQLGKHFQRQADSNRDLTDDKTTVIVTDDKTGIDLTVAAGKEGNNDELTMDIESCSCGTAASAPVSAAGVSTVSSQSPVLWDETYCHPVMNTHDGMMQQAEDRALQRSTITRAIEGSLSKGKVVDSLPLVDAHCHLQLDPLYRHSDDAIAFALSHGIAHIVVCGTQPGDDWARIERLHNLYPSTVVPNFGLHPWWIQRYLEEVDTSFLEQLQSFSSGRGDDAVTSLDPEVGLRGWEEQLEALLLKFPLAGVGECGLDKAVKKSVTMERQEEILSKHIAIASKLSRPLTIHCVSGCWGDLLRILQHTCTGSIQSGRPWSIVLHSCNTLPVEMVAAFNKIPGLYYSLSGKSRSDKLQRLLLSIPRDRLLLETDSPDQLPTDLKRDLQGGGGGGSKDRQLPYNEPTLLRYNCLQIAQLMGVSETDLAAVTFRNSKTAFNLQ